MMRAADARDVIDADADADIFALMLPMMLRC